jgi:hypothetical protein
VSRAAPTEPRRTRDDERDESDAPHARDDGEKRIKTLGSRVRFSPVRSCARALVRS